MNDTPAKPELSREMKILYLFMDAHSVLMQLDTLAHDPDLADKKQDLLDMKELAESLYTDADTLRQSLQPNEDT